MAPEHALEMLNEMLTDLTTETDLESARQKADFIHGAARMGCRLNLITFDQWEAMDEKARHIVRSIK